MAINNHSLSLVVKSELKHLENGVSDATDENMASSVPNDTDDKIRSTSETFIENTVLPVSSTLIPLISYEAFVWTIFLAMTALAIVDRFTTNYWPRQAFRIGKGSAGNDRLVGLIPGPWSVAAYDVIARVSGRHSIMCFNLLLIVRLKSLEHALQCSPFANRLLDCRSIMKANIRLHRWNAIVLCVLTVVHVWSILLPCVTHGYKAQVIVGFFEYPISERPPPGFKDADSVNEVMSLEIDDVWRIVEMTVLLCILMPLSVRWLVSRWHVGMPLHRLIMILYFVDIARRHTHPHSWVLNTPVFLVWVLDKIWFWYSNRSVSPLIHRIDIGGDYMVLLWRHPQSSTGKNIVAPDYHLRLNDSSLLESPHIFSAFENRGQKLALREDVPFDWTVGTVVQVFYNKRAPKLGAKDSISHTSRMYGVKSLDVTSWGAYNSEMSAHLRCALLTSAVTPVILIGAGSGLGFIIDVIQWKNEHAYNSHLKILYSTRCKELFEWARRMVQPFALNTHNQVTLALTGIHNKNFSEPSDTAQDEGNDAISVQYSHFRFKDHIDEESLVFCQGSQKMNDYVSEACIEKKAKFIGGLQSPERIDVIDALRDSIHGAVRRLSLSSHSIRRLSFSSRSSNDLKGKEKERTFSISSLVSFSSRSLNNLEGKVKDRGLSMSSLLSSSSPNLKDLEGKGMERRSSMSSLLSFSSRNLNDLEIKEQRQDGKNITGERFEDNP